MYSRKNEAGLVDRRYKKNRGLWEKFRKLRNSLPGLIIESVLITFGVLLAFAVDSWKAQVKLEKDTVTVLENLRHELISNRSIVLEWLSYHDSLSVKLGSVLDAHFTNTTSLSTKERLETLYPEPTISYLLQTTAWQTAHSAGVVKNFQYRTTYNLTHCYEYQHKIDDMLSLLFLKLHDSSLESRDKELLKVILSLYRELSAQETYILGAYRDALIEVDKELVAQEN